MTENVISEAEINASKLYHQVKSYNNFDNIEVFKFIQSLIAPSMEENCFIATYYRARGNVETLLQITNAKHFQAAAMLARAMFELAVDMKSLETTPNGWLQMVGFSDLEKLRCARELMSFKKNHPDSDVDVSAQEEFVKFNEIRVDALHKSLWPAGLKYRYHWSGVNIGERVEAIGDPMDRIYKSDYPRLSWYVHSGLTGVLNLKAETFVYLCSSAFALAAESYRVILEVIIRKLKINRVINKLDEKLYAAKVFSFVDDPEVEAWLARSIQD